MAEEKSTTVKAKDKTTVYGTGKSYMVKDKAYEVHPVAAKKLIAKGAATASKDAKKEEKAK